MTRVLIPTPINTNAPAPPRILLIGAGPFGREHLKEWLVLTADGEAKLAGVVVSNFDENIAATGRKRFRNSSETPTVLFTSEGVEEEEGPG